MEDTEHLWAEGGKGALGRKTRAGAAAATDTFAGHNYAKALEFLAQHAPELTFRLWGQLLGSDMVQMELRASSGQLPLSDTLSPKNESSERYFL